MTATLSSAQRKIFASAPSKRAACSSEMIRLIEGAQISVGEAVTTFN